MDGMTRLMLVVALATLGSAATATAVDPWQPLHRPLHLPSLAAGDACPVSRVDRRVDWTRANIFGGSGIGRGPAYPGLGGSRGRFTTRPDTSDAPWFGGKIFWYVRPS